MHQKQIRIGLSATLALSGLGLVWVGAEAQSRGSQWHPKDTEWAWYTADMAGTKYRPLDQINASNLRLRTSPRRPDIFAGRPPRRLPLLCGCLNRAKIRPQRHGSFRVREDSLRIAPVTLLQDAPAQ
jgi:hypothetical protein